MAIVKASPAQSHIRSVTHSFGVTSVGNNTSEKTLQDLARDLTRRLNRRGCRLRVKRRRRDSNPIYAEKQLVEVGRRLERAWDHISKLQQEAMDCERDLVLARSDESSLRKPPDHRP